MTKKSKYGGVPVQTYAFGGIANPSQRAFLRGSDQSYLNERQKELDAFEAQRLAYNDQLTKWQNEVYNPYKAQVDAYNTASQKYNEEVYNPYKTQVDAYNAAAEKYNTEVYNPYKTQFDKYKEAVDAWNAGDRTSDYAGPAEPTLASQFTMAAPTQPKAFEMAAPTAPGEFKGVAPVLPFKEEEVIARQKEAATRAQKDAGNRAVAIDAVSNPDQFNFGSMSVSHRFMAKGGEVNEKSAKEMLGEMDGGYSPSDAEVLKMVHDISSKGKLSHSQIMEAVDRIAAQGRGGDELLAYLSPQSVELLKKMGGAGSINPATGLHEFKGGVLGKIVSAIKNVFNPKSAAPAAAAAAPASRANPAVMTAVEDGPRPPTAAELQKQLDEANSARTALQTKYDTDLSSFKTQAQKDQEAAVAAALKADAEKRASMVATPVIGTTAASTAPVGTAKDMLTQIPANQVPATATKTPTQRDITMAMQQNTQPASQPSLVGPQQPATQQPAAPVPKDRVAMPGLVGSTIGSRSVVGGPVGNIPIQGPNISFDPVKGAAPLPKLDLRGNITSPAGGRSTQGGSSGPQTPAQGPDVRGTFEGQLPYVANTPSYSDRGVGSVGPIGNGGSIPIFGPTGPSFGGSPIGSRGGAATNPNSYFGLSPQNSTGLAPGSAAIGPADMPLYGAKNTMNALGSNPNLSPTMLGGQQNAGVMTDRLGNRIYSPGMNTLYGPPGFAKGGGVDLAALNAENLSDEPPEETINTNPVGSAQQMLADINSLGQTQYNMSPTRQSIKRSKVTPVSGDGVKGMKMEYESLTKGDLGDMRDLKPAIRETDSAKAQMEELARVYKLKIRAAENKARGLMADTMGAPTLEQPTLTKGSLTKKRFEKGGEAKKAGAESVEEPSIFGVTDYATKASARMYPDQMGQDDERDAARHMLAAATMSKKYGPGVAEFMGKAHERMSNPESFFSMFGIGKPREDYEMDVHNNRIGAQLGARATSQTELEKLVQAMARESRTKQTEGKPWTMSREQMQNRKGQVMTPPPEYRADGSPEEGEIGPAFVTPKSGKGRKEGEISRQLKSGEAYTNMAKGVTELPYDIAGAPVDLATMLLRPFGYGIEKPVMGSDWIKEQMTGSKPYQVRPEPPADPTAKGFYTAGELLSNLTNPAGVTRSAVKGAKKTGEAATAVAKDFQEYNRQLAVPGASYAVRPTGSTVLSGPVGMQEDVSGIDKILKSGLTNATLVAGQNEGQAKIIQDFWDKKARNYFTRQFGTPDDPVAKGIASKQIKGSSLEEDFPEYMIDQINMGKTRVKEGVRPEGFVGPGTPESRFFPKYPRAMDDFTARYDKATGLKGNLITSDPAAANQNYSNLLSDQGRQMARTSQVAEEDKMIMQGVRPEMINANVGTVTRSPTDYDKVIGDGTPSADALFKAYKEAGLMRKMDAPEKTSWINQLFGEGRKIMGKNEDEVVQNMLPENIMTAINRGEPVYDIGYGLQKPLQSVFDPLSINKYLASIPPREAANIRFEDAIKGALKMREQADQRKLMVDRIKSGKPVADKVFSEGVSAPLLQIDQGPLEGFSWKRIEKREATVPEGAYVGHSVGGYETGGAGYSADKREGFGTGKWQVYTLRDNRNRPVNTVEVKMLDENTPVVTQIKGNGRASGNTAPETYDSAVLQFFQNYLKPAKIEESDSYLTPLLQTYKTGLESTRKERDLNNLYRELGLE